MDFHSDDSTDDDSAGTDSSQRFPLTRATSLTSFNLDKAPLSPLSPSFRQHYFHPREDVKLDFPFDDDVQLGLQDSDADAPPVTDAEYQRWFAQQYPTSAPFCAQWVSQTSTAVWQQHEASAMWPPYMPPSSDSSFSLAGASQVPLESQRIVPEFSQYMYDDSFEYSQIPELREQQQFHPAEVPTSSRPPAKQRRLDPRAQPVVDQSQIDSHMLSGAHPSEQHLYAQSHRSASSPPQHHHHRLPRQVSRQARSQQAEQSDDASIQTEETTSQSVVGHPGMPDPAPRPKGPKLKFTPEDDELLIILKETKDLTWRQIADFFPGRSSGTLQVRYSTKLKAKDTLWTDETTARLRSAVREYDVNRWRWIAGRVGNGFSPSACRDKAAELAREDIEGQQAGVSEVEDIP